MGFYRRVVAKAVAGYVRDLADRYATHNNDAVELGWHRGGDSPLY